MVALTMNTIDNNLPENATELALTDILPAHTDSIFNGVKIIETKDKNGRDIYRISITPETYRQLKSHRYNHAIQYIANLLGGSSRIYSKPFSLNEDDRFETEFNKGSLYFAPGLLDRNNNSNQ